MLQSAYISFEIDTNITSLNNKIVEKFSFYNLLKNIIVI